MRQRKKRNRLGGYLMQLLSLGVLKIQGEVSQIDVERLDDV